jgi:hypothetical protein
MAISPLDNNNNAINQLDLLYEDPISNEIMENPVIDPCGHTFDMSTIEDIIDHTPQGQSVLCPISRQVIDVNRLVVNRFAKEAIERYKEDKKEIDKANQYLVRTPIYLEMKQYCEQLKQENQEVKQKFNVVTERYLETNEKYLETNEKYLETNEKCEKLIIEINEKAAALEKMNENEKQQVENLKKMSWGDGWRIFWWPDTEAEKIMNRKPNEQGVNNDAAKSI